MTLDHDLRSIPSATYRPMPHWQCALVAAGAIAVIYGLLCFVSAFDDPPSPASAGEDVTFQQWQFATENQR